MNLPGSSIPQRHLRPGEWLVTQEHQWVITLLGSCVAVTMFHARWHLAAICHAMLPKPHDDSVPDPNPREILRYVSHAIPAMIEPFTQRGLLPSEVVVKMFGGANVIDMGGHPHNDRSIGNANIAMARHLLRLTRFHIQKESVGGHRGCKILFNTQTGQVLHKRLSQCVLQK